MEIVHWGTARSQILKFLMACSRKRQKKNISMLKSLEFTSLLSKHPSDTLLTILAFNIQFHVIH